MAILSVACETIRDSWKWSLQTFSTSLALLCAGVFIAGCSSPSANKPAPNITGLPPVTAAEVKLQHAGDFPGGRFDVITPLCLWGVKSKDFEARMKTEAGSLGANGVIGAWVWRRDNIGPLQSGIAVRWLPDGTAPRHTSARSAVAVVPILAVDAEREKMDRMRDGIEVVAARHLYERGYVPIFVTAKLPSGTNAPSSVSFDLLDRSEAGACDKMLVLRLAPGAEAVNAGVFGWNHAEMTAQLVSRTGPTVLWERTKAKTSVGLGVIPGIVASDPWNMVMFLTPKVLDPMPKNTEKSQSP